MGRNAKATLETSFFIGSSSFLQVAMTCVKAYMSSKFGQIMPPPTELSALQSLKNQGTNNGGATVAFLYSCRYSNKDMHKCVDEFVFQPDLTTGYGVSCPWTT